ATEAAAVIAGAGLLCSAPRATASWSMSVTGSGRGAAASSRSDYSVSRWRCGAGPVCGTDAGSANVVAGRDGAWVDRRTSRCVGAGAAIAAERLDYQGNERRLWRSVPLTPAHLHGDQRECDAAEDECLTPRFDHRRDGVQAPLASHRHRCGSD